MEEEEETAQERQSNELVALKSIFADQLVDCNAKSAEWKPLDIILTVFPSREHSGPPEIHVQLDLHVSACAEYPNKVPKIRIENAKGLSDRWVADMQNKLQDLAVSRLGEVIVYDLAEHVQSVLTERNQPAFESCYEEMLSRQKEREQKEVEMQKTEEDRKRQLIALEVKGIKKERQRKKKGRKSNEDDYDPRENDTTATVSSIAQTARLLNNDNTLPRENDRGKRNMDGGGDYLSYMVFDPYSRLVKEFELFEFIGKGAFGDVLKAKHKLDSLFYAIKRIKLNLNNKQANRKILREVKLLSRLNHENVVRYHSVWIENLDVGMEELSDDNEDYVNKTKANENVPSVSQSMANLNLSLQYPKADPSFSDEDNDDDDDDEDDENDDWIEFKDGTDETDGMEIYTTTVAAADNEEEFLTNQCMYIQMEYCEKSTLRSAIDNHLHLEEQRVWRLLREVVEGLAYIHEQGIIHRDLKPVNIFIDSYDHVKIGDFGLATPNKTSAMRAGQDVTMYGKDASIQNVDASHTGQVGTALYVAPEIDTRGSKVFYNQRVDIYSLGIIFFEMNYRPLSTQMERYKILNNLRTDKVIFPEDCKNDPKWCRQIRLISALLNHTPSERPSAKGILEKGYLPISELENQKLMDAIRHTMSNPQSKMYKYIIAECFKQKVSPAEDITYNTSSHLKTAWHHAFIEKVAADARKVFRMHGGTYFNTPFFTPCNGVGIADLGQQQPVSLMNRSGWVVCAPYDLRITFARYLAQNPHTTHMRRYVVDKVFRERRMLGAHPKETFECAFDIVGPQSGNLTMEAEVLSIVCELLDSFSDILKKNYVIRLNHVSLITAILFHHHLTSRKHATVCNFLSKAKFQNGDMLTKVNMSKEKPDDISEKDLTNIIDAMNVEIAPNKMMTHFANMMRKSSASCTPCKLACEQLEKLVRYLSSLKIKCQIVIAPNIITNYQFYSGVMFQVVWERRMKSRLERDIIANGGRYDKLITQYRNVLNVTKETKQSAVGLSIFIDRLTNILQKDFRLFSTVDVLVCSVGACNMDDEKLKLMKELWEAEIRSTILDAEQCLEETQDYCARMNIPHILLIKDSEPGTVRLRTYHRDRFNEKKFSFGDIVPHLRRTIKRTTANSGNAPTFSAEPSPFTTHNHHYSRSESRSASASVSETHTVNVTSFIDEKSVSGSRRRYENQVMNSILGNLSKISVKTKIELILLSVPDEVIRQMAAVIDLNKHENYFFTLNKRFPKYKKYLSRVGDHIEKLRAEENMPAIVLYSVEENTFKIVI